MANPFAGVRWLWMLLGGVLVEVVLFAVAAALYGLAPGGGEALLNYVTPPACFLAPLLVSLWLVRKATSSFVLNGVVLGAVAALLYAPAFFFADAVSWPYLIAEALKVVGGAAGGAVVGAQAKRRRAV